MTTLLHSSSIFLILSCLTFSLGSDLTISVLVRYPEANLPSGSRLGLRGQGWTGAGKWGTLYTLNKNDTDTWSTDLSYPEASKGSSIQFKILILADKQEAWQLGANTLVTLQGESSEVKVFPWFFSQKGQYTYPSRSFYSPQLNNYRTIVVYTPPSYLENTLKRYSNVIIMHDGQNLFNASTSFGGVTWGCDVTVDEQVLEGNMEEVVIVGAYNTGANRINEYTYSYSKKYHAGGEGNKYLDFLEHNVIPFAKEKFRIDINHKTLGMIGSSLGGLITCYAGWTRQSHYGKLGCMSSSFWWNNYDFNSTVLPSAPTPQSPHQFYVDVGTGEPPVQTIGFKLITDGMLTRGMALNQTIWTYQMPGGHHNEHYWGKRFWRPMQILYPVVPTATAEKE